MVPGMAAEPLEVRMARLEGAYEQIDRRLAAVEAALQGLRAEIREQISGLRAEIQQQTSDLRADTQHQISGLRAETHQQVSGLRAEMRQDISDLRREMRQQFFWLLGVLVVSILVQIALRYIPTP